jgi:hypothetical protein
VSFYSTYQHGCLSTSNKAAYFVPDFDLFLAFEAENALCALRFTAKVSLRKMRSNSSGYPGHARFDFLHCVHVGRTSSHCVIGKLHDM